MDSAHVSFVAISQLAGVDMPRMLRQAPSRPHGAVDQTLLTCPFSALPHRDACTHCAGVPTRKEGNGMSVRVSVHQPATNFAPFGAQAANVLLLPLVIFTSFGGNES